MDKIEQYNGTSPLVSMIVPVYNTEDFLSVCIESILNQEYKNLELILVDDGSTDRSPDICDQYHLLDSRIKVIHKSNEGSAVSRAKGLSESRGKYIMFVDSDDWIDPCTVRKCVETAEKDHADCVMFGYVKEYPGNSMGMKLFDSDFSHSAAQSEELVHCRIIGLKDQELQHPETMEKLSSMCMKLYRRETAEKGRVVSEKVIGSAEDAVFNLYALNECAVSYLNQCFYHYRKTNTHSITSVYRANLSEQWDILYSIFQEHIESIGKEEQYKKLFLNRVACGMVGLGLNEISSKNSLCDMSRALKNTLRKPLYREAFQQLNVEYCPVKWKLFFALCKENTTWLLVLLLRIMNWLRSRVKE